ncbi:MAG: DUF4197 domain-containing protein [Ginsengibacter sp.]
MKTLSLFILLSVSLIAVKGQKLKNILNTITSKTTGSDAAGGDISDGLKQALEVGTQRGLEKLSGVDGFFADAAIKILMPEEAKKVEQKLRAAGFGSQVDNAILSMNRAAEDAAKSATPVFVNAIRQMSFQDAMGILRGGDFAATGYLKNKTSTQLTTAFRPIIQQSLEKVNATKYWNTIFSNYNKFSFNKVNPDIEAYVTEKALSGIFYQLGLEEQKIRKDPAARTTDLLKKVFSTK